MGRITIGTNTFQLQPTEKATISGRVYDAFGRPIMGAEVKILVGFAPPVIAFTDSTGLYVKEISVPANGLLTSVMAATRIGLVDFFSEELKIRGLAAPIPSFGIPEVVIDAPASAEIGTTIAGSIRITNIGEQDTFTVLINSDPPDTPRLQPRHMVTQILNAFQFQTIPFTMTATSGGMKITVTASSNLNPLRTVTVSKSISTPVTVTPPALPTPEFGRVVGVVWDTQRNNLVGASVVYEGTIAGVFRRYTAIVNAMGEYAIPQILGGTYTATVSYGGKSTSTSVFIAERVETTKNFMLEITPTRETTTSPVDPSTQPTKERERILLPPPPSPPDLTPLFIGAGIVAAALIYFQEAKTVRIGLRK